MTTDLMYPLLVVRVKGKILVRLRRWFPLLAAQASHLQEGDRVL